MLILPDNPLFDFTLATIRPPGWKQVADKKGESVAFIVQPGSGIMRPATWSEMQDYLNSGEYDERLKEIGEPEGELEEKSEEIYALE